MADTITHPPFESIHNFRDVGKVINSLSNNKIRIKEGMLLRSGRLDEATAADAQLLKEKYHLKTVIDLRTKSEHLKQQEVLQDTGLVGRRIDWNTVKISFIGRRFEINLLKQLRWWQVIWVILLMLMQRRMAAIRVMGQNVMRPRGLVGLSKDSLQFCQSEILQALEVYLDPDVYPVLIHCTQGKDRAGLVMMIVLFVLGVPLEFVKADYVLSDKGLERVRESMMSEVLEIGMDENYTRAPANVVEEVWKYLQEGGGVGVYLDAIGFGHLKRQKLKEILLE
ncbi:hypothetical protein GYMLUDRAFT_161954 [Collybiopsis luxurians FD-317 M1]|uniref:Tyrosine specific protein phosphatases domain-containing protein n=1 Tax=Collybiopsis luxurians FD-317 M1 TaxID=944289 RepID=A0A0D0D409_9AGAR|nr:hypothetical protein GYMLUDRAFT_161954 [Collybiopsis luxurians FD-317 M1]